MGRLLVSLGIVVTAWAVTGCGGGSGVVAVEGNDDARQAAEVAAEQSATERIETVGAQEASSQAAAQPDRVGTAAMTDDRTASDPSPEDLSTGPILRWTAFDPGVDQLGRLFTTGDGRVVMGGQPSEAEPYFIVTADGSTWSELHLPPSLWPNSFDLTGERWALAGWPRGNPRDAGFSGRIYVSDDRGSTWHEARLEAAPRELPEHALAHSIVVAVATSGPHVVAAVRTHLSLDFEALLGDRGLLPSGAGPRWISIDGDGVGFELFEEPASDSAQQTPAEPLRFTVDELGLSAEQMAIVEGAHDPGPIRVYSGSGPVLTETAVLDGRRAHAIGNARGFIVLTEADGGMVTLLTSPDGHAWSDQTPDGPPIRAPLDSSAIGPGGSVWMLRSDGSDSYLTRWSEGGSAVQGTWLADFPRLVELSSGPAGLAATAMQPRPEPAGASSGASGLPVGRVAKDGYELRYGEPEGGITLWDLTADAAVYEFGPEIIESDEIPEGVREDHGDIFELTFEDPDTGEDLVTFTEEDLQSVFGVQRDASDSPFGEMWIGWSADGTNWGWQTVAEAFGLGDAEATATVAVGEDFVIASVQVFDVLGSDSSDSGSDGMATWSSGTSRWFIARVP
ncbi:hypothetical protein [Candidatus Poriferisodalis multihospitum]|uniref:hypothetical protein n=1 Tax=Candidatus Poriferisodalis multihospitum TaxID=2983191 RepID=UPI002B25B40E|nr:hypothetical protein [Candidatus Poriferisodalis multihospitum]